MSDEIALEDKPAVPVDVESSGSDTAKTDTEKQEQYYFGCDLCRRSKWIQKVFADAKFYTSVIALCIILEGSVVSGNKHNSAYSLPRKL